MDAIRLRVGCRVACTSSSKAEARFCHQRAGVRDDPRVDSPRPVPLRKGVIVLVGVDEVLAQVYLDLQFEDGHVERWLGSTSSRDHVPDDLVAYGREAAGECIALLADIGIAWGHRPDEAFHEAPVEIVVETSAPRIYLMTDYSSSSLWTDEPFHCMVSLDGLPLSEQTKADLIAWSARDDEGLDAYLAGKSYDPKPDLIEGRRLWSVVREELGTGYEVGLAFFDPNPWDELSSTKRIIWDPAEAPAVEEVLAVELPAVSDADRQHIWDSVVAEVLAFCASQMEALADQDDLLTRGAYGA